MSQQGAFAKGLSIQHMWRAEIEQMGEQNTV